MEHNTEPLQQMYLCDTFNQKKYLFAHIAGWKITETYNSFEKQSISQLLRSLTGMLTPWCLQLSVSAAQYGLLMCIFLTLSLILGLF